MGGLAKKLLGTGKQEKLYVDEVFSTYPYTGNGFTQTINNGIDLAGEGGLVWIKNRTTFSSHYLADTLRGAGKALATDLTSAERTSLAGSDLTSFNNNGFTLGSNNLETNSSGSSNASWTFRRAKKFFDIVTYTGNGASNRQIAHELGIAPGFITTKATSTTGDWNTYHRSATGDLKLNRNIIQTVSRETITAADAGTFTVSRVANTNGVQYVAYLFAHDPSADGIIQCGSFTTDASGNATVNLGWEPQWLMIKSPTVANSWQMHDSMRGFNLSNDVRLYANISDAELLVGGNYNNPTATGFQIINESPSATYIYLAIRRPNKPPKTGAEVYFSSSASGVIATEFPVDLHIGSTRAGAATNCRFHDRLRGGAKELVSSSAAAESTVTNLLFDSHTGLRASFAAGLSNHFFRRAIGFMDLVCDTGTGAAHAVAHNLAVAPEMVIRKSRSAETQWEVWHSALAANEKLVLNSSAAKAADATAWNGTAPGASAFTVGTGANVNANSATFVTCLFATLAGISKVGSYTGNGGSQPIDCGFTTGARFFLVKAVSAAGSWWVYDSARGIVAAADPALQLNSTVAEITSADAVDPHASGIIVNQEATCSINASGVTYAFLAIA